MGQSTQKSSTDTPDIVAGYAPLPGIFDELMSPGGAIRPHWRAVVDAFNKMGAGELVGRFAIADRHLRDSGVFYRVYDEEGGGAERVWPLDPAPLVLPAQEWERLAQGLIQRARLLELILDDFYGPQRLIREGALPAALIAGNPEFLRPLHNQPVRGAARLHKIAVDLGRGPDGQWWVLSDRTQAPSGAGYALENRIALSRALPSLYRTLNVQRLAPWFDRLRQNLATLADQEQIRIGLLTPGPLNETYFEHAYLARYLGFLLVEGADLTVRDDAVYVRTVGGLKRVNVLLRRLDADFADPLEFTGASRLGVPGLAQAVRAKNVALANALGSGALEARALMGFMPSLCRALLGEKLAIPNVATWWCGQPLEREAVLANLNNMALAPALGANVPGLLDQGPIFGASLDAAARARFAQSVRLRGMDVVGQEIVKLSTMPVWREGRLQPRPFSLRVFLTRTPEGWAVMPGGFCRVSDQADARALSMQAGGRSADVWVLSEKPVEPVSLLPTPAEMPVQRVIGYLTSRAADHLFWLGRYIERAEATLRLARCLALRRTENSGDGASGRSAHSALIGVLEAWGALPKSTEAAPPPADPVGLALFGPQEGGSVTALAQEALRTASVIRDRVSPDGWRTLNQFAAHLTQRPERNVDLLQAIEQALRLVAAFSGLAQENMNRLSGWRFLELGRRIERALVTCRFARAFANESAQQDELDAMLELADSVLTYRARYLMGASRRAILDLALLDPGNPRAAAFQVDRIVEHLAALPQTEASGLLAAPRRIAIRVQAELGTAEASDMTEAATIAVERRLMDLSDAITERFFTHPADAALSSDGPG